MGAVIFAVLFAGFAAVATADAPGDDEVSRITRQVSQEIYSPYCPGQTLQMCPSSNAAETRREIQQMARQGMDADQIKRQLLDRYGDEYEMVEPSSTDEMALLGGIVGGLLIAVAAVGFFVGRLRDGDGDFDEPEFGDGDDPEGDEYLDELRAEYRD